MKSKKTLELNIEKGDNLGYFNYHIKVRKFVEKFITEGVKMNWISTGETLKNTKIELKHTVADADYKITVIIEKTNEDEEPESDNEE